MKIFQFFNYFICVSSVTEFSNEQNKPSTRKVFYKHHCYRTFISRFARRLMLKKAKFAVIIIINEDVINFKFNFTFFNTLIYNRAAFNYRVLCCVDFITESRQPVKPVARRSVK